MIRKKYTTVAAFIADSPKPAQAVLKKIRATIRKAAPKATEGISYNIPVFKQDGKYLVYIAGYAKHVSIYPFTSAMKPIEKELAPYRSGKGTIKFSLDKPIPYPLITKIVKARLAERKAPRRPS